MNARCNPEIAYTLAAKAIEENTHKFVLSNILTESYAIRILYSICLFVDTTRP